MPMLPPPSEPPPRHLLVVDDSVEMVVVSSTGTEAIRQMNGRLVGKRTCLGLKPFAVDELLAEIDQI